MSEKNTSYNPWDFAKLLTKVNTLVNVYRKFGVPNKTQYGITNQSKTKYTYNKFKLYKWIRRNKYKWISNSYNYKLDYVINVYVPSGDNKIYFKPLTSSDTSYYTYNLIRAPNSIEGNKLFILMSLFDEHHICGAVIDYKPAQIVRTVASTNRIPNILFSILTGREYDMMGDIGASVNNIQYFSDRPYVRMIAADDDCRIYRPFKLNKNKDVESNDQVFYSWLPTSSTTINYALPLVGCFVNPLENAMEEEWQLGNIRVTLYYRFRNSKI